MFAGSHFSLLTSYLSVCCVVTKYDPAPPPPPQCLHCGLTKRVMSISLGPDDLTGFLPPSPPARTNYPARRRTVSTSFEQVRHERIHIQVRNIGGGRGDAEGGLQASEDRKTQSYAYKMEELPKLDLKKTAMINNFLLKQSSIIEEDNNNKGAEEHRSFLERIPGMGIFLTIVYISIYQGGNVVAKKMTVNPFMMIFLRDLLTLLYTVPFNVRAQTTPFPRGQSAVSSVRNVLILMFRHHHYQHCQKSLNWYSPLRPFLRHQVSLP